MSFTLLFVLFGLSLLLALFVIWIDVLIRFHEEEIAWQERRKSQQESLAAARRQEDSDAEQT